VTGQVVGGGVRYDASTPTAELEPVPCRVKTPKQREETDPHCRWLTWVTYPSGTKVGYFRCPQKGGHKRIKIGRFGDATISVIRKRAEKLMAEFILNPESFLQKYMASESLGSYIDEQYLPAVRVSHRSPKTIESRVKLIKSAFGHVPLNRITRADIESFLVELSKELSVATVNRYLAQFKAIMTFAVEHEVISSSPASGIPAKHEAVLPPKGLPAESINKLIRRLMDDIHDDKARLLLFLLATGCRLGEARTLQLPNCDITSRIAYLPTSKSGRERLIPLNDLSSELVEYQRQKYGTTGLLFRGKDELSTISEPRRYWYRICEDCGLVGVRIHDLRHTVATSLLNAGCSLDVLQKVLGHSSPKMTERYARYHDATLLKAVNKLTTVWEIPSLTC
jgi:integrase